MTTTFCEDVERRGIGRRWPACRAARWRPASRRLRDAWMLRADGEHGLVRGGEPLGLVGRRACADRRAAGWRRECARGCVMFSGALTIAAIVRWPSVVGPMSTMRDAIGLRARRARSTARCRRPTRAGRSAPMRKPKCASGVGICAAARPAAPAARVTSDGERDAPAATASATARRASKARSTSITATPSSIRAIVRRGDGGLSRERDPAVARRAAAIVAPRCESRDRPRTSPDRRADAARAPPGRCRAARRGRGRGRGAPRASPAAAAASTYSLDDRRRCRAARTRGDRAPARSARGTGVRS